ncbi:MAG: hypothetical protein AAFZ15_14405 [Bacteroidota bacterium]
MDKKNDTFPLPEKEFRDIAQKFVDRQGVVLPGFRYGVGEHREFIDKHYFNFIFVTLDGQIPDEPPIAGGTVGFTIDKKTKDIRSITHGQLGSLHIQEQEINLVYEKLTALKEKNKSLVWLKSRYGLTSKELLKFKKALKKVDLERKVILNQIADLVKNIKYEI